MLKITDLMGDAQCYEQLRELRWGKGPVRCPRCDSDDCHEKGTSNKGPENRKYHCADCGRSFNDLTGTLFAESNLPLKAWMGCLYLMNLNTSNHQIANELGVSEKTTQHMATKMRRAVEANTVDPMLSGDVEFDEVYIVAGHKGHPEKVKKGPKGAQKTFERRTWQRHAGKRKATCFGYD